MRIFQRCLHILIFCKFASILQLQPAESLVFLRELNFCVTILHLCQPVNNSLGFAVDRIVQFFPVPFHKIELTGLKTCLFLCFPEGCLQVILSWIHMAFGGGPVMGPIGCLEEEVFDTVSSLRRRWWLQSSVDYQATCSYSHVPLLTQHYLGVANRNNCPTQMPCSSEFLRMSVAKLSNMMSEDGRSVIWPRCKAVIQN